MPLKCDAFIIILSIIIDVLFGVFVKSLSFVVVLTQTTLQVQRQDPIVPIRQLLLVASLEL